jgi:putative Na+/H+ antiporter
MRSLVEMLRASAAESPLNIAATIIFFLAVAHTFLAARFTDLAHALQRSHAARPRSPGRLRKPSVFAEILHLLGEVEVVFGFWVVPLIVVMTMRVGWEATTHYLNDTVNYTEALFVVVIMALASTRPIVTLAEGVLRGIAALWQATPAAWWATLRATRAAPPAPKARPDRERSERHHRIASAPILGATLVRKAAHGRRTDRYSLHMNALGRFLLFCALRAGSPSRVEEARARSRVVEQP